jgi:hypothetical protein
MHVNDLNEKFKPGYSVVKDGYGFELWHDGTLIGKFESCKATWHYARSYKMLKEAEKCQQPLSQAR